jgi:DNA-directed RNA polymerase sigma subunit (sigma70/sigma32)
MDALHYRLGLFEVEMISLDQTIEGRDEDSGQTYADIVSDLSNPDTEVTVASCAEDIFDRLTDRQRHVLVGHLI